MEPRRTTRRPRRLLGGCEKMSLLCLLFAFGCDSLVPGGAPEMVSLEVDSPDLDEIVIVESMWFEEIPSDPECEGPDCPTRIELVLADTVVASLPHTRQVRLNERIQYYVEAYPGELVEATVSMSILLDDREWYNDARRLRLEGPDGQRERLTFAYQYRLVGTP